MKHLSSFRLFVILILCLLSANIAWAINSANLFFVGAPKEAQVGQRFSVSVKVGSSAESVNAVSGSISFPDSLLKVVSISKEKSIINLWISEPTVARNKISFEGVILNPGFQGSSGQVFNITFEGKKSGKVFLNFNEGSVLANDGRGSNILGDLGSVSLSVVSSVAYSPGEKVPENNISVGLKTAVLPVITKYTSSVEPESAAFVKGEGEPGSLTKLIFRDISIKSAGEKFLAFLHSKKIKPEEIFVKNDSAGRFLYVSANDLMAGIYNVTPFLIDGKDSTEKPGVGVNLFIKESATVDILVVLINVLVLLIPIVGLIIIIYFIPWYSLKRMRVLKDKLLFEEEKIKSSEQKLKYEEKVMESGAGGTPTSGVV